MATMVGAANNNPVQARNVYPTSRGPTIAGTAGSLSPFDSSGVGSGAATVSPGMTASGDAVAAAQSAAGKGFFGQPLTWFLLLLALLVSLRFIAGKFGEGEDFKNIRVTVHNVIIISLASIIGIGFFKVVLNRWPVPGLTTYINAV